MQLGLLKLFNIKHIFLIKVDLFMKLDHYMAHSNVDSVHFGECCFRCWSFNAALSCTINACNFCAIIAQLF